MSIKGKVEELRSLRQEMKSLTDRKKALKGRVDSLEQEISEYLKAKEQPGVKHNGMALVLEQKDVRVKKPAKMRDVNALEILEKYGIPEPEKVLSEIIESRKGEKVATQKLLIKKVKGGSSV